MTGTSEGKWNLCYQKKQNYVQKFMLVSEDENINKDDKNPKVLNPST